MKRLPAYELRQQPLIGTPHTIHTLIVSGHVVHAQLSPHSHAEAQARIRDHLNPPPVRPMRPFSDYNYSQGGAGKRGRPRKDALAKVDTIEPTEDDYEAA